MGRSPMCCFMTDTAAARGSAAAGFIIGLVAARVRQQRLRQLYLLGGLLGYARQPARAGMAAARDVANYGDLE